MFILNLRLYNIIFFILMNNIQDRYDQIIIIVYCIKSIFNIIYYIILWF